MAEHTKIEWCAHTFNPWRGCQKVSPGCANCYAETLSGRNPSVLGVWGPQGTRVMAAESYWEEPLKWDRDARLAGERRRVFCASLADVFEDWDGPITNVHGQQVMTGPSGESNYTRSHARPMKLNDVRRRLFALIDATPNLDWLVLTKRPENIVRMLWSCMGLCGKNSLTILPNETTPQWRERILREFHTRPNLWLGTSIENQPTADERTQRLKESPATLRFLSCEPLLASVRIPLAGIDWVIVGGESGGDARPCDITWIRSIVDQCARAGVPCFVKQFGAHVTAPNDEVAEWLDECAVCLDDVDIAGMRLPGDSVRVHLNHRRGGEPDEWPRELRIRQFPRRASHV